MKLVRIHHEHLPDKMTTWAIVSERKKIRKVIFSALRNQVSLGAIALSIMITIQSTMPLDLGSPLPRAADQKKRIQEKGKGKRGDPSNSMARKTQGKSKRV